MSDTGTSGTSLLARSIGFIVSMSRTAILVFVSLFSIGGLIAVVAGGAAYMFGAAAVAGMTAGILALGSSFIEWAGRIFNFFIENLITKFSVTLTDFGIMAGIDTVWAAFRDVANIALIGLFVFLAINIILGVKSFGEKKMIARVLIVAVLLNFSLLFSKIIIDGSNLAAYQFYRAAGLQQGATATTGGVADVFLHAMGITGIADTYAGVKAMAEAKGAGTALGFSAIAILLIFLMIILLLYGAFQIVARSILLVFLMAISPLAFASWLVPSSAVGAKWSEWWHALISSAFFAPLFMMMLWASMTLLQRVAQQRGNTTLGQFFTGSAATPDAWTVIFLYCFAAGLLYGSIRISSTLSSSIAGYATVSQGLRNALVGIPGLTSRFAVAPFLRQTVGRRFASESDAIAKQIAAAREAKDDDRVESLMRRKSTLDRIGGSSFNAMNTGAAKALTKNIGVQGFLSGANEKALGFAGLAKARAEKGAKEASELTISKEEKDTIQKNAYESKVQADTERKKDLQEKKKATEQELKLKKEAIKEEARAHEKELSREQNVREAMEKRHEESMKGIAQEISSATSGSARRGAEERYSRAQAEKESTLSEQDSKINAIKDRLVSIKAPENAVVEKINTIDKQLEGLSDEEIKKTARDHSNEVLRQAENANVEFAKNIGARLAYGGFTSALQQAAGINPAKDTVAGKMAAKMTEKKMKTKSSVDFLKQLEAETKDGEGGSGTPEKKH